MTGSQAAARAPSGPSRRRADERGRVGVGGQGLGLAPLSLPPGAAQLILPAQPGPSSTTLAAAAGELRGVARARGRARRRPGLGPAAGLLARPLAGAERGEQPGQRWGGGVEGWRGGWRAQPSHPNPRHHSALLPATPAAAPNSCPPCSPLPSLHLQGTCEIVGRVLGFFEAAPADVRGAVDVEKLYDGASACTLRL